LFSPIEVKPLDRDTFDASFSIETLGGISLIETYSRAAEIERTECHVAQIDDRRVFLLMPIQGPLASSHYGHDVEVEEGDFVMTESLMPSRTSFVAPNHSLGVLIPYDVLTRHIPDPEAILGMRVHGDLGFGQMVNTMLRAFWAQIERGIPAEFGARVARNLLDLVATAYAMEHRAHAAESSIATARRAQIKRFIECHLRDSDLTAQSVATGIGLSSRYTRLIFSAEGEGISDYILRRRLEECAHQFGNAWWRGRSITDTAFEWGFSSMAHFTRAFKEQFAVTPTEYRRSRAS
jgi:AraC-like DNA-binding protein